MRAIIMADGAGKRWSQPFKYEFYDRFSKLSKVERIVRLDKLVKIASYAFYNWALASRLPKRKHFLKVYGETLIERQVRLLNENGVEEIYITSSQEDYNFRGTKRFVPENNVLEIDRFYASRKIWNSQGETLYIYGDTFYSNAGMRAICSQRYDSDINWFGRLAGPALPGQNANEIFCFRFSACAHQKVLSSIEVVREAYLNRKLDRCIGWELLGVMEGWEPVGHYKPQLGVLHSKNFGFIKIHDETADFDKAVEFKRWYARKRKL